MTFNLSNIKYQIYNYAKFSNFNISIYKDVTIFLKRVFFHNIPTIFKFYFPYFNKITLYYR